MIRSRLFSNPFSEHRLVSRPLLLCAISASALLATSLVAGAQGASTRDAAVTANDPLLTAMQQELAREKELLILPGMQRPYFMEYRLEDLHSWNASANYGALTGEGESRQRVVRVEVRIGDYKSDSSSARGEGSLALAPQDNDTAALRYALWTATDEAYKNALRAYAAKQAALKRFQSPPTANDFTPAKSVVRLEPLLKLDIDREDWKHRIVEASGLYATAPEVNAFAADVQYSSATISGLAVNRYTVNTDGTILRHGYGGYADSINVGGQAPDGMQLGRNNGTTAATAAGLESFAKLKQRTLDDLRSYNELRNAPVVDAEDYHGPVLFSGDAAADVFNRLFVPNVEADRPDMGTTARTQGAYQSSLHSPVLPAFLTVMDDPTLQKFDGQSLVGAYSVDDEGVPVTPVTIVDRGKLVDYLIGREPVKDFPESNGHGRAALGQASHSKAGVIVVKPAEPLSSEALRAKLLALAKDEGRDVYEVETLAGDLSPRLLYRVSPDGKRSLVRGAVFDELDQRSLRSEVIAAGGDPWVSQTISPVPETTIVPGLLFADIAVKRATEQQAKLPYYSPPANTEAKQVAPGH
ncbi:MAG TPA: metallopeptidase TldD-related protein [Acidobacteriaceae bacterium]